MSRRVSGRQVATYYLFIASKDASGRLSRCSSDRSGDASGAFSGEGQWVCMAKSGDADTIMRPDIGG
jgi:hypothetical protein